MELYQPHLTIIRLKDEKLAEEVAKKINWELKNFFISKLAIYTMSNNGTCVKLVDEFLLAHE